MTYLLVDEVGPGAGRVRIRRAKHGDAKEYSRPRDLVPVLRRYLRKRSDAGPYLFAGRQSNNQRGLTVLRVQQLFKGYALVVQIPSGVASHSLRPSIAVHTLQEGCTTPTLSSVASRSRSRTRMTRSA